MMNLTPLNALSPLDGRYRSKVLPLTDFFSEAALIRYRILVEVEYFISLSELSDERLPKMEEAEIAFLRNLYLEFKEADAQVVKEIESNINHDVKAIEYYIKQRIEASEFTALQGFSEYVHFGLTSQDINNTAIPLMFKHAVESVILPQWAKISEALQEMVHKWEAVPMLARTHGQAATPTTIGKEIAVFLGRLQKQLLTLREISYPAKFGGASGNLNAHYVAFPEISWHQFADQFVQKLKLSRSFPTTQIEPYDGIATILDTFKRINSVMIDLCQDFWLYISIEYFGQKLKENEVGSSAMPHKVNPIDFENAEGNAGLSSAIAEFMARKLPVSRLQRDLSDSTVLRNIGVILGYHYLASLSLAKGLSKVSLNPVKIQADLDANWSVLAEAIQTILRREGFANPYEVLKQFSRGKKGLQQADILALIDSLEVSDAVKEELRALRPETYLGNAAFLSQLS